MTKFWVRHLLALVLSWVVVSHAVAESTSEIDFHSKVVTIYSFEPHKLNKAEMKAKSDQLDQFWSYVKADPKSNLPFLRKELADPSNAAFFYYDGSKLLLSLSKDRSDQALALRSIPKADLRGVDLTNYLKTVHWFAQNEFDTREAAFRILAFPEFKAFIPQHFLTLGQNYSLIYMLFPMDESIFLKDLAGRLSVESDAQSLKSVILALWYTVTPTGNSAIKKFIDDPNSPAEAKSYAKELLGRNVSTKGTFSLSTAGGLKVERRDIMRRPISDEALMEFDKLTAKLLAKQ